MPEQDLFKDNKPVIKQPSFERVNVEVDRNPYNNPYIRTAISWAEFKEQGLLDLRQFQIEPPPPIQDGESFKALVFCTVYTKSRKLPGMHLFLGAKWDSYGYLFRGLIKMYDPHINRSDIPSPHYTGAKYLLWGSVGEFQLIHHTENSIPHMSYPQVLHYPDFIWEIPHALRGTPKLRPKEEGPSWDEDDHLNQLS